MRLLRGCKINGNLADLAGKCKRHFIGIPYRRQVVESYIDTFVQIQRIRSFRNRPFPYFGIIGIKRNQPGAILLILYARFQLDFS